MARQKQVSTEMGDLIDALGEFRQAEATIKAKYVTLAEKEIAEKRDRVLDIMFIKHRESGPSEIANTTGLSRSTVIRWRKEFEERAVEAITGVGIAAEEAGQVLDAALSMVDVYPEVQMPEAVAFSKERDTDSNVDYHVITNYPRGEKVYVVWHDSYAAGYTAEEAMTIERPEWLTDDMLAEAEQKLGFKIPGA